MKIFQPYKGKTICYYLSKYCFLPQIDIDFSEEFFSNNNKKKLKGQYLGVGHPCYLEVNLLTIEFSIIRWVDNTNIASSRYIRVLIKYFTHQPNVNFL